MRGAITFANFSAGTDTINLSNSATYKLTVAGANEDQNATGDLDIMESVTINGNNSTIDATGLGDRAMEFYPGAIFGTDSIHDLVIKGGKETGGGGGGGLMINSGTMTLDNVSISGNHSAGDGGDVFAASTVNLTVTSSKISGNTTDGNGGGLFKFGGSVNISNTTLNGNTGLAGGAIYFDANVSGSITNTTLSGNTATVNCGVSCGDGGGAIESGSATVTITGGSITGNQATHASGGGISSPTAVSISGTTVQGNTAAEYGGGIYSSGGTISGVQLIGNTAGFGGGVSDISGVTITHTVVQGNQATYDGGGLHLKRGSTVDRSEISGNTAGQDGGGIALGGSTPTIVNSTISSNVAHRGGGISRTTAAFTQGESEAQPQGGPQPGLAAVKYVTIAHNTANDSASIYNDGTFGAIDVGESIIAYPSAYPNCNLGAIASAGYNVEDGTSCSLSGTHDVSGADPKLGTLSANGANTRTDAFLQGSPAIDLIPPNACSVTDDQRGVARPHGHGCDAGAYESSFTATNSPTPSPPASPTATPAGQQRVWGDMDCDTAITLADMMVLLRYIGGVLLQ